MAAEGLDPMRLLTDDVKDDDLEVARTAIERIKLVAIALGPARVRGELLPWISDYLTQENDQAMYSIAKQLGDFVDLVGGPQYALLLLSLLEKCASMEECVIRDAAAASLNRICPTLSKSDVATKFLTLLTRLATGEWFTSRVSACQLFTVSYPLVSEIAQSELRTLFLTLAADDMPMVRKAAAIQLGPFSLVCGRSAVELFSALQKLSTDDADSMRIHAVDGCVHFFKLINPDDVLLLLEALSLDASWRVRVAVAKALPAILREVDGRLAQPLLVLDSKLMQDREQQVRSACALYSADVCSALRGSELPYEYLVPQLETLVTDSAQLVRVSVSKALVQLLTEFPIETAVKLIVPLIEQISKDEQHEVRQHVVATLLTVSEALLPAVMPTILELAKDPKWRVRYGILTAASYLARSLGAAQFERKLLPVIITALTDHVFAIRDRVCEQVGLIVKEFGSQWAAEKLFPQAFGMYDVATNYLHRMTCLLVIVNSAPHCDAAVCERSLLPLVTRACTDDVPNVRILAAKTMGVLCGQLDKRAIARCQPFLAQMLTDADKDVAFAASQAIKAT